MKTTQIILAAVIAATSAIQAATAEHKLPASLPEFKTPEQLVVWRKEMAAKAAATDALAAKQANSAPSPSAFYTGKPYLEETGSYAFMFRQYDPEFSRWTSADPSGFPDGANNASYAPIPTTSMDWQGLKKIAWVYYTPSNFDGNPIGLLNANISNLRTEMNNADSASGSTTHYLDDGDTFSSLIILNTAAAINNLFSTYDRVALFSHGNYFQNQYYWGGQTSGHLTTVFGSNAGNIMYATCFNAYSPGPTSGATGVTDVSSLLTSVKSLTKDYLRDLSE